MIAYWPIQKRPATGRKTAHTELEKVSRGAQLAVCRKDSLSARVLNSIVIVCRINE